MLSGIDKLDNLFVSTPQSGGGLFGSNTQTQQGATGGAGAGAGGGGLFGSSPAPTQPAAGGGGMVELTPNHLCLVISLGYLFQLPILQNVNKRRG